MNNRHRRVAKLRKQELNAAKAMKSFEQAMSVYGLNPKETTEAMRSFELFVYGNQVRNFQSGVNDTFRLRS
ncbi:toxin PIN [Enterococcus faecium]|uniref:toxin PIN n=1 Tax=Enterococcus faecium TaxID=1352 RepID=UPI0019DA5E8C|nr:toxin PIN [Enterococcus faecium]EGP5214225.1 toxin PIN [Enterococcus faecium]